MQRFLTFFLFILSSINVAAKQELRMVSFNLPPLFVVEGSQVSGMAVDYLQRTISDPLKIDIVWQKPLPVERLIESLRMGKSDAVIAGEGSAVTKQGFPMSPSPFYEARQILIAHKTALDSETNNTVGVARGSTVPEDLKVGGYKIVEIGGEDVYSRMIKQMVSQRLWAVHVPNHWVATIFLAKKKLIQNFKMVELSRPPTRQFHLVYSPKLSPQIRAQVDDLVAKRNSTEEVNRSLYRECFKYGRTECDRFATQSERLQNKSK